MHSCRDALREAALPGAGLPPPALAHPRHPRHAIARRLLRDLVAAVARVHPRDALPQAQAVRDVIPEGEPARDRFDGEVPDVQPEEADPSRRGAEASLLGGTASRVFSLWSLLMFCSW